MRGQVDGRVRDTEPVVDLARARRRLRRSGLARRWRAPTAPLRSGRHRAPRDDRSRAPRTDRARAGRERAGASDPSALRGCPRYWPVSSARTNSSARWRLATASRRGTSDGRTARASFVSSARSGVATTKRSAGGHCHERAMIRPSSRWQLMVIPPSSEAEALSGCPSISDAIVSRSPVSMCIPAASS